MSQIENDQFCINCKVNLTQGQQHSEACNFLQKAEAEKKQIQEKADKAIQKAKDELEAKAKDEKEKITKEVREQLEKEIAEEKQKKKELLKKKDDEIKLKFIAKILQFVPNDEVKFEDLENKTLDELMKYYRKIIQLQVAELKKKYNVSCPKCGIKLGKSNTEDEGRQMQKDHKKDCLKYKKSNLGNWLLVGFALSLIAGSVLFLHSNPHVLKKGKSKDE